MTQYTLTITSDTICPWCYIGYRRLQLAISQHLSVHPNDTFTTRWRPFLLNPKAPRQRSVDKRASYEQRLGPQQTELIFERIRSAAEGTGIVFSFEGRTGSSVDAHRVVEFAGIREGGGSGGDGEGGTRLQTRLVEELFKDYFERERDITSHSVLIEAAKRVGLDRDETEQFLESDRLVREVEEKAAAGRDEGITGVPYFDINGVFSVEGAQESAAFLMLFQRLKKRERKLGGSVL